MSINTKTQTAQKLQHINQGRKINHNERNLIFSIIDKFKNRNLLEEPKKFQAEIAQFFDSKTVVYDAKSKRILKYICLLCLDIHHDYLYWRDFLKKILSEYPAYNLYKIYKHYLEEYHRQLGFYEGDGRTVWLPKNLGLNTYLFTNIEHFLNFDNLWSLYNAGGNLWVDMEYTFLGSKISRSNPLVFLLQNDRSIIERRCIGKFNMTYAKLEKMLGVDNSLWIAIQAILTKKFTKELFYVYFSTTTYYFALTFLRAFGNLSENKKLRILSLGSKDLKTYLFKTLTKSPDKKLEKLWLEFSLTYNRGK